MRDLFPRLTWGSVVEIETRHRIQVLMHAYRYEVMGESVISDHDYDKLAYSIDLSIDTNRPDLDRWFRKEFQPSTGSWIHCYPERDKLKALINRLDALRPSSAQPLNVALQLTSQPRADLPL